MRWWMVRCDCPPPSIQTLHRQHYCTNWIVQFIRSNRKFPQDTTKNGYRSTYGEDEFEACVPNSGTDRLPLHHQPSQCILVANDVVSTVLIIFVLFMVNPSIIPFAHHHHNNRPIDWFKGNENIESESEKLFFHAGLLYFVPLMIDPKGGSFQCFVLLQCILIRWWWWCCWNISLLASIFG